MYNVGINVCNASILCVYNVGMCVYNVGMCV